MHKIIIKALLGLCTASLALAQITPTNPGDLMRKMSARMNEAIQQNADLLDPQDQRDVIELLRQIRQKLQFSNPSGPILVNSQTFGPISRASGGQWVTLTLPQATVLSQISIRSIGTTKIRIYRAQLVNTANEKIALNLVNLDVQGSTSINQPLNLPTPIKYIQILAESFGPNMNIGIDSFAEDQQNGQPAPYPGPGPIVPTPIANLPGSDFICISKFGNDAAPFLFAIKNPVDFSIKPLGDIQFGSRKECTSALSEKIVNSELNFLLSKL